MTRKASRKKTAAKRSASSAKASPTTTRQARPQGKKRGRPAGKGTASKATAQRAKATAPAPSKHTPKRQAIRRRGDTLPRDATHTEHQDAVGTRDNPQLLICSRCSRDLPPEAWMGAELPQDPSLPLVCPECAAPAPDTHFPDSPETIQASPIFRRIAVDVFQRGLTLDEARRKHRVGESQLNDVLQRRGTPERRLFQMLLEREGLDAVALAQKAPELLNATRMTPQGVEVPDNTTQARMWKELVRIHELISGTGATAASGNAIQVNIQTNLGSAQDVREDDAGVYRVEARSK